jgi:lipopolysaccharide transport system permease protein
MNKQLGVLRSLRLLIGYRSRLMEGVIHDVRQQYRGSVLGSFWAFLLPLLQLSIYAGLYTVIFKVRPPGLTELTYTLLVFSGLVPLLAFGQALTAATNSLTSNKSLLLNTVFPAELIPVRAALAAHVPILFGLGITMLFGFALGRTSWQAIFLVPVFWVLMLMFAVGLGWMLSLLSLVARDIQHSIGLVIMLCTILSPFAFTPEMVPASLKIVIYLNPLSYFVLTFQQLLCYGTWPNFVPAFGAVILGIGSFVFGFMVFQRAKNVFFDYA